MAAAAVTVTWRAVWCSRMHISKLELSTEGGGGRRRIEKRRPYSCVAPSFLNEIYLFMCTNEEEEKSEEAEKAGNGFLCKSWFDLLLAAYQNKRMERETTIAPLTNPWSYFLIHVDDDSTHTHSREQRERQNLLPRPTFRLKLHRALRIGWCWGSSTTPCNSSSRSRSRSRSAYFSLFYAIDPPRRCRRCSAVAVCLFGCWLTFWLSCA